PPRSRLTGVPLFRPFCYSRADSHPDDGVIGRIRPTSGGSPMRIRSSLSFAAAAVALAATFTPGPVAAQAADRPWVFVSDSPSEPADRDPAGQIRNILLRPNVDGTFYVYVRNPTERDQEVTVLLSAEPADGSE